jgi:RimJ/RimL family protein N-acetyltransferase
VLERWRSVENRGEFNDFGVPASPAADRLQPTGQRGALIAERVDDGTPIGLVSWREVRYAPNPESIAWNIGISLIPEARGHGFGSEAQRLLAAHLFATTPAQRIEAGTDADNLPEQRALEKAGFQREGVLRRAQYRRGAWHDLVVYACLRASP